ncbi:hypothetical protein EI035_23905, partial [Escherichia coli]|nr:hypothetical protein [Escherichia coli]
EHLESLLDKAGSSLVVVAFYTRSCGVCKELLKEFQSMCEEAKAAQVRWWRGCIRRIAMGDCVHGVHGAGTSLGCARTC